MKVELTKTQCENLIDLFRINFLDIIREGKGIDSLNRVVNLCDVYKAIRTAYESEAD